MTKVIKLNTKEERVIKHSKCIICNCKFKPEEEGGLQSGMLGIIPVSFCPTCFTGIFSMVDYFRADNDEDS